MKYNRLFEILGRIGKYLAITLKSSGFNFIDNILSINFS
jgi:hypothetical protein